MFSKEAKAGIVNNLGTIAGLKADAANVQILDAVVEVISEKVSRMSPPADIGNVKVEIDGKEKGLTQVQASKVFAAVEFQQAVVPAKKGTGKETVHRGTVYCRHHSERA